MKALKTTILTLLEVAKMCNLLSANFIRLKKNKPFIASVFIMIVYAIGAFAYAKMQEANGSSIAFDTVFLNGYGLGGFIAFPGIILSIVCSMFVGTDFSDGTLRNKIIVGKSRSKIYFANFISCAGVGIFLNIVYSLIICIIGLPILGGIEMPMESFLFIVLDGLFMIVAYAAIYNMIAMLSKDKTIAVVIGLVVTIVSMFLSLYLMMRTFEPEFVTSATMVNGEIVEEVVHNSKYLGENARKVVQTIIDILPSGQSVQLSHLTAPNIQFMYLYSLIIIFASNFIGVSVFKKTNLK